MMCIMLLCWSGSARCWLPCMLVVCLCFLGLFVWECVVSTDDGDFRGDVCSSDGVSLPSDRVPRRRMHPFAPDRSVCAPCVRLVYILRSGKVPRPTVGLPRRVVYCIAFPGGP